MNNRIKDDLNNGLINVIATTEISNEYYKYGMPLDYLLNRLKRISKNFKRSIHANTNQLAFGFENVSLDLVQSRNNENLPAIVLVNGINSARVDLVLDSTQVDSSKLLEEVNEAKAQFTQVITESAKIAQKISANPLSANQLEAALNKNQYPSEVRNMLGNMSESKETVIVGGEVMSIGGYNFSAYCSDGEVMTFTNCEILKVLPNGQVVFDTSGSKGFSLTDFSEPSIVTVDLKPDTLDFSLLAFVFAAKLALDIEVRFSKHVVKQHNKCWLVQILNKNKVSEEILNKWLEISQKLNIVI